MPNTAKIVGKRIVSRRNTISKNFNRRAYADLLVENLPGMIRNEKENEQALAIVLRFMKKGKDGRSPEEERFLELSVTLIESYEEKEYPMGQAANPQVAVRELMREHNLKQTDMLDIFGSQGTVSQVLNGKREISKTQARRLADRFRLPIDLFIR